MDSSDSYVKDETKFHNWLRDITEENYNKLLILSDDGNY